MKPGKIISLFLLPGLLLYGVFFLYPTVGVLFYSTTDWDGFSEAWNYVGMENYRELAGEDIIFMKSFTNNLTFMSSVVIFQTLFSLLFALLLVKNTRTNIFFRALFFFPTILSSVAVAFIWSFLYDPTLGFVNLFLAELGLGFLTQNWLGNPAIAIFSISFVQIWAHTGQMLVIFVAGLQAIPEDLYEVAKIEGATRWQTFTRVTWPLVAPAATIVVAYTTIQSFKAFDLIFAMTRGGPNYATEILSTFIYHTAFESYAFGYASAGSVIFMLIIATLTYLQFRLLKSNQISY